MVAPLHGLRTAPPQSVAALPQQADRPRGLLAALIRPLRWIVLALANILRSVLGFGSASAPAPDPAAAIRFSAAAITKLQLVCGIATRSFAPPDDAYLCFDYTFSPFYSTIAGTAPDSGASAPADNATVRWLH